MKSDCMGLIILAGFGWLLRLFILFVLVLLLISCSKEDIGNNRQDTEFPVEGSWMKYSPYKWTHDGKPYCSVFCTVFSDGCPPSVKESASKIADSKFIEILELFDFSDLSDLRYPTERKTIDVYINRNHPENITAAYWGSIMITLRADDIKTNPYNYLFKHELIHAFEFLIEGTVNLAAEMWFTEGIAILGAGGFNRIRTVEDLDSWILQNEDFTDKGNPITIKKWEDYPEGVDKSGYTAVFELVMEYLLDQRGLDRSTGDVLNLFYDLRNRRNFEESFYTHFGITVKDLEDEIFSRLKDYLSKQ